MARILITHPQAFASVLRKFRHMLPAWHENTPERRASPTAYLWVGRERYRDGIVQLSCNRNTLQWHDAAAAGLFIESEMMGLPFWPLYHLFCGRSPMLGTETCRQNWKSDSLEIAQNTQFNVHDRRRQIYDEYCERYKHLSRAERAYQLRGIAFLQLVRPTDKNAFGFSMCEGVGPRRLTWPAMPATGGAVIEPAASGGNMLTFVGVPFQLEMPSPPHDSPAMPTWRGEDIIGETTAPGFSDIDVSQFPVTLRKQVLWKPSSRYPAYLFEHGRHLALGCRSRRLLIIERMS